MHRMAPTVKRYLFQKEPRVTRLRNRGLYKHKPVGRNFLFRQTSKHTKSSHTIPRKCSYRERTIMWLFMCMTRDTEIPLTARTHTHTHPSSLVKVAHIHGHFSLDFGLLKVILGAALEPLPRVMTQLWEALRLLTSRGPARNPELGFNMNPSDCTVTASKLPFCLQCKPPWESAGSEIQLHENFKLFHIYVLLFILTYAVVVYILQKNMSRFLQFTDIVNLPMHVFFFPIALMTVPSVCKSAKFHCSTSK